MVDDLEKWRKASRIAAECLAYAKPLIKPGASLLDITEKVESRILQLGAKPAFPVQISLNHVAAHYCASFDDKTTLKDQLVKVDVGVSVDGCIGDNACTVDLSGRNRELVEAAEKALDEAIKAVQPGVAVSEVGQMIQQTVELYNLAPVRNLSGHSLEKFDIHAGVTIPNFNNGDVTKLEEGQIIAVEPFATNGAGIVIDTSNPEVFMLVEKKPVRDKTTREILAEIESYEGLPFAKRWLCKKFSHLHVNLALNQLSRLEIIRDYPPMIDKERGLVSQAEHTVLVKDKPEVLTLLA